MPKIRLNRKHFFSNLDAIAKRTKGVEKIALVLKDNAYGHGLLEIATLAKEYGISRVVVRTQEEALALKEYFAYILVLADKPQKADEKIHYTINDLESISSFAEGTLVELKVDTGMNRNGVHIKQFQEALAKIKEHKLLLKAIFTHHSCADESTQKFTMQQKNFAQVKAMAPDGVMFHSCNSAALFRSEDFDEDMARVGIAAYGCLEFPKALNIPLSLQPVLSVYASKNSSRAVESGESVGYGSLFVAEKKEYVTNYDFGYADGFLRACSSRFETPNGVKIVGRISMDNSSFLSKEEEILIFNDAKEVAKVAGTISYEVLTSLKAHIPREIV